MVTTFLKCNTTGTNIALSTNCWWKTSAAFRLCSPTTYNFYLPVNFNIKYFCIIYFTNYKCLLIIFQHMIFQMAPCSAQGFTNRPAQAYSNKLYCIWTGLTLKFSIIISFYILVQIMGPKHWCKTNLKKTVKKQTLMRQQLGRLKTA